MSSLERPFSLRERAALLLVLASWSSNYLAVQFDANELPVWAALSLRFSLIATVLAHFHFADYPL